MTVYDIILQGHEANDDFAMEYAKGFVFSDVGLSDGSTTHSTYIDTVGSIDIWYNYGADYYFFAPSD